MKRLGFSETEIMDGLIELAHKKVIELLPGRQLRVLIAKTSLLQAMAPRKAR